MSRLLVPAGSLHPWFLPTSVVALLALDGDDCSSVDIVAFCATGFRVFQSALVTEVLDRFLATRGAAAEGHTIAAIVVFDVHVGPVLQQNNDDGDDCSSVDIVAFCATGFRVFQSALVTEVLDRFLATRGAAAEGHTMAAIVVFDVHVGPVLQQNNELGPWAARAGPRC